MADRVSVMDHGRIAQTGTPGEVYEAPRTRYVADFVGTINLVEGRVEAVTGNRVELDAGSHRLSVENDGDMPGAGDTAWFAVRPEKLRVSKTAPTDGAANAVKGEVWDIAYLGDMTIYNVHLPSGAMLKASVLNATRAVEDPITYEDEVWINHAPDAGTVLIR